MEWGVPFEKLPPIYKNFVSDNLLEIVQHHFLSLAVVGTFARFGQGMNYGLSARNIAVAIAMAGLAWPDLALVYSIVYLWIYTFTKLRGKPFDKRI